MDNMNDDWGWGDLGADGDAPAQSQSSEDDASMWSGMGEGTGSEDQFEESSWDDLQNDVPPAPAPPSWNDEGIPENFDDVPNQGGLQEAQPAKIPMKLVGIILAVVILAVALIFMFIDKVKISPKPSDTQEIQHQQQTEAPVQDTQNVQQSGVVSEPVQSQPSDVTTLLEIPDSTAMNYSGDILTANGKITARRKFVQGHQVIYGLEITIAVGSSSEVINFYCNYATFNAVGLGDVVIVKYQQVSDSYISVNEVTK